MNAITPAFPWSHPITSSGWDILNARRLFKEVVVRSHGDEPLASATQGQGIVARSDLDIQVWNPESDTSNYKRVEPGQFVISLRSFQGGFEISNIIGMVSPAYTTLQPLRPELNVFYRHFFKSEAFISAVNSVASGIRQGKAIKFEDFASLSLPVPPVEQAQIIAGYLDRETGRIDALVDRLERLIKLLAEKRQAVLSHAVTKGLNPDAPMKDSGIDWLGEVPAHWEVKQVKHVLAYASSGSRGWAEYYADDGSVFLQSGNIGRSMDVVWNGAQRVSLPDRAEGQRTRVSRNDILVCITGGRTGAVGFVDADPEEAYVNQHVALVRGSKDISSKYLAYCLFSKITAAQFALYQYGGTKEGLGLDNVKHVVFAYPPADEQMQIARWLDSELEQIGSAVSHLASSIDIAKERRSALISAAVTGQIHLADMTPDLTPEDAA